MAFYKNRTKVDQIVYNKLRQPITIKPGDAVDSDKLGIIPSEEEGFEKVSIVGNLFVKEAPESKASPEVTDGIGPVSRVIDTENLTLEEKLLRDQNELANQESSPVASAAIKALLEGKPIPEAYFPQLHEAGARKILDDTLEENLEAATPRQLNRPNRGSFQSMPDEFSDLEGEIIPDMVDPMAEYARMHPEEFESKPKPPEPAPVAIVSSAAEVPLPVVEAPKTDLPSEGEPLGIVRHKRTT